MIGVLDADERHDEPQRGHPVSEDPAADLLADPVHREERDGAEHEDVEEQDPGQRGTTVGPPKAVNGARMAGQPWPTSVIGSSPWASIPPLTQYQSWSPPW